MLERIVAAILAAVPWAVPVTYLDNYDGDTITFEAPVKVGVRVQNIDTPEIKGKCEFERRKAAEARDAVAAILDTGRDVRLTAVQPELDVYGRVLANVVVDGVDLGERLVAMDLARRWDGKRRPWC